MCYHLSAEKILLNYFAEKQINDRLSFENITAITCKIVSKCNNSIVAHVSFTDIQKAVMFRSEIFKIDGASVIKKAESPLFKNIDIINQTMPPLVKQSFSDILS